MFFLLPQHLLLRLICLFDVKEKNMSAKHLVHFAIASLGPTPNIGSSSSVQLGDYARAHIRITFRWTNRIVRSAGSISCIRRNWIIIILKWLKNYEVDFTSFVSVQLHQSPCLRTQRSPCALDVLVSHKADLCAVGHNYPSKLDYRNILQRSCGLSHHLAFNEVSKDEALKSTEIVQWKGRRIPLISASIAGQFWEGSAVHAPTVLHYGSQSSPTNCG